MKRNNLYVLAAVIVVALAAVFFFLRGPSSSAIGNDIQVTAFTSDGEQVGKASVAVPFLRGVEHAVVSVAIDLNKDGAYSQDEIVVKNRLVGTQDDWVNRFYFSHEARLEGNFNALVMLSGEDISIDSFDTLPDGVESVAVNITVDSFEIGTLLDLSTVTNPEESMKGPGFNVAYAEDTDITTDGVPDISQRPGECAPTSAANSLISLINQNGNDDQKPDNQTGLIDDLKKDMNWTPQNGVLPDDFVRGKNTWAARNGIPIRTKKVGDKNGISTIDAIQEALENGDAVELRIKFGNPATGKAVGGHMVTVTGIHVDGDEVSIDVNDPASPTGTDSYEINGNLITDYPFEGWTVLSWGFVQTWEGDPTGVGFDTLTDEEISGIRQFVGETSTIKVIQYGEKYLPVSQLTKEDEEGCDGGKAHWHASQGGSVMATDGSTVNDPGPQCGYGKLTDKPITDFEISTPDFNGELRIEGGIFGD